MPQFTKDSSISDFQKFQTEVYGLSDDRNYSLSDLLVNQQRFTMRAIKGIRKGDTEKLKLNVCISLSWLMAVANRLHIHVEETVWQRFPERCSYCGEKPCVCKKIKQRKRGHFPQVSEEKKPVTLSQFQEMFSQIYPPASRSLSDAGVHLAEEMGEVSEAIHNFLGEHKDSRFQAIPCEIADYMSCVFGAMNSANLFLADALADTFKNNCNVCHQAPCTCSFPFIADFES
ncbi:MAG: hypothetical protein WC495_03565 [Patescibacteria group bacterium]|jgi:NTP pyrophosphatase (non-canonical NTP hydrolase)